MPRVSLEHFSGDSDSDSESAWSSDSEDEDDEDTSSRDGVSHWVRRTRLLRAYLQVSGNISGKVLQILELMTSLGIDLPIFLAAISWNFDNSDLVSNARVRYARTALMKSDELPLILRNWYKPPRKHGVGTRTTGANEVFENLAFEIVDRKVDKELRAVAGIMRSPQSELCEDNLIAVSLENLAEEVKLVAPQTWTVLRRAAYTPKQEKRNKHKNPDAVVLTIVSMLAFSRSHNACKLPKLLSIYFRSCGLATKAFDTLHALGLSMNQKWVYSGIDALSAAAESALLADIHTHQYPWLGMHDNLNIRFIAYDQQIDNKTHFDSGTAGTIIVINDPDAVRPSKRALDEQLLAGGRNPITTGLILKLESLACTSIDARAAHRLLTYLFNTPAFSFDTYQHKDSPELSPPAPIHQLKSGPAHATRQYMLRTVHMEEASYEGNERVLEEWMHQLKCDTPERMKKLAEDTVVVWSGDQLTVQRIRGLKKHHIEDLNAYERLEHIVTQFGWFHAIIALESSLHKQYYGTRAGRGLVTAFETLGRKGLHAPSVQGTFHHNIQEAFEHIAEARFRDLWRVAGGVEDLSEMRSKSPAELLQLANQILRKYASTEALQDLSDQPRQQQDDVLHQSIMFNRDILDYLDLIEAVRSGDVGAMEQQLPRMLFRFVGGQSSNYQVEVLELLQSLNRDWPKETREYVMKYGWLANTTGRPKGFLPHDLLQEHNIRDIKHTFGVLGPYATWEAIHKMSASIPCQRRVKDHVEAAINHFQRGKSHTSPDAQADIARLEASFRASKIHESIAGRHVSSNQTDYVKVGAGTAKLTTVIGDWAKKRRFERGTKSEWGSATAGGTS